MDALWDSSGQRCQLLTGDNSDVSQAVVLILWRSSRAYTSRDAEKGLRFNFDLKVGVNSVASYST